jgi:single-strand DNA-binding protein
MVIGNLGADPEMRYTADGTAMTSFRMASSRSWSSDGEKKEQTEWFSIVCWRKLAEIVSQYLQKGSRCYVEGRLQTRSWDKDGQKQYRTEVIANEVIFLSDSADRGATRPSEGGEPPVPEDIPFE